MAAETLSLYENTPSPPFIQTTTLASRPVAGRPPWTTAESVFRIDGPQPTYHDARRSAVRAAERLDARSHAERGNEEDEEDALYLSARHNQRSDSGRIAPPWLPLCLP